MAAVVVVNGGWLVGGTSLVCMAQFTIYEYWMTMMPIVR